MEVFFESDLESSHAKLIKWLEDNAEYFDTSDPHYSIDDDLLPLEVAYEDILSVSVFEEGSNLHKSVSYESELDKVAVIEDKACFDDGKACFPDCKGWVADANAWLVEEKASFVDEKAWLVEETISVADEKAWLVEEKDSLVDEKAWFDDEKESFANEKASFADGKDWVADKKAWVADDNYVLDREAAFVESPMDNESAYMDCFSSLSEESFFTCVEG